MTSKIGHLPQAFLQPITLNLRRPVPSEAQNPTQNSNTGSIIEAEWSPLSNLSQPPIKAYQTAIPIFTENESSPLETVSPSAVTDHYQKMAPKQQFNRGTIVDTLA